MLRILAFLLSISLLASCATVFARDTREVMITSNPPGAEIMVNGRPAGMTPARIPVNDHERLEVTMSMPGYKPAGCYINTSVGAVWVIVDLVLFYTIVPLVIDLVTGEWSSLNSEYCTAQLVPMQGF